MTFSKLAELRLRVKLTIIPENECWKWEQVSARRCLCLSCFLLPLHCRVERMSDTEMKFGIVFKAHVLSRGQNELIGYFGICHFFGILRGCCMPFWIVFCYILQFLCVWPLFRAIEPQQHYGDQFEFSEMHLHQDFCLSGIWHTSDPSIRRHLAQFFEIKTRFFRKIQYFRRHFWNTVHYQHQSLANTYVYKKYTQKTNTHSLQHHLLTDYISRLYSASM